jgi:hypothetical protein
MNSPLQTQILRRAIESPLFSKDVLPKTPSSIFEGNEIYKELSSIVKRYYQTHSKNLSEEAFLALTEDKLDRMRKPADVQQEYFRTIHDLYEVRDYSDDDIIDEKIEKHIRKHMWMELMKEAAVNLENEKIMESISERWKTVMLLDISGKMQEIINVIDDKEIKRRLLSTLQQNTMSTGFKSIDILNGGGLAKGELGLIIALSGSGKTMMLTNLATNYTKLGRNVLFIELEELENRMILKFEQSMLRQNRSDIVTGSILNETHFEKMQDFYKNNRDRFGNLFFARYSPRTITPSKVEQLIADVKLRQGIDVDVVIIDYPELLRNPHSTGNESEDGGHLFEEMRRIAQDYNVAMWTASQMNRTAYNAPIRTAEHMEGSHRKKNACELILTVNQTKEEYNEGFIRLYVDKVRNPPEGAYDNMIGLRVVGSTMTIRDYKSDQERRWHMSVLQSSETSRQLNRKDMKTKDGQPIIDYAKEINSALTEQRKTENVSNQAST